MNLQEAYSILELPTDSSPEDAKKKFRELSKIYHPDNKETGDESKFKKLNEAHQFITKPETRTRQAPPVNVNNIPFNFRQNFKVIEDIKLGVDLTFAESILGCKKTVKYKRKIKCNTCDGDGVSVIRSSCSVCHGSGHKAVRQGNMTFISPCDKCGGKKMVEPCKTCNTQGVLDSESEISINIPGGVSSSSVLRLQGKGNFFGNLGAFDQYLDAFVELNVSTHPSIKLIDNQVVSNIDISLLEAIKGCQKTVETVMGFKEIIINPLSKNKEEVFIPNVGINGVEPQKIILNVEYPKDVNALINVLSESK